MNEIGFLELKYIKNIEEIPIGTTIKIDLPKRFKNESYKEIIEGEFSIINDGL